MRKTLFSFPSLLLLIDGGVIVLAWVAAFYLRVSLNDQIVAPISGRYFILSVCLLLPIWLIAFGAIGLYRREVYQRKLIEASRLALGSFIGILIMIGVDFMSNQGLFAGRLVVVYGFGLLLGFLVLGRGLSRLIHYWLLRRGIGVERLVVVGAGPAADSLIDNLLTNQFSGGCQLAAVVGVDSKTRRRLGGQVPVFATPQEIPWGELEINSLVLASPYRDNPTSRALIEQALRNYVGVRLLPADDELLQGVVQFDLFAGLPTLIVAPTTLSDFGLAAKRLFDIVLSVLGLLLLGPLILALMVIIKLTSPRQPAIFRHQRLTRYERVVVIFKLRTMHWAYSSQDPAEGLKNAGRPDLATVVTQAPGSQLHGDPRVTRLGRWLRRWSLDELPQLVNILRGDISFVGPRALPRRELIGFEQYIPVLLSVKTGLTGLAQVSGRSNLTARQKIQFNIYYIQNWSLWLDFTILLKTINQVLRRKDVNV